jgi:Polyketide cyclase / dehydrase and lipid transport
MASIREERGVEVSAAKAWAALRDVGNAHKLFAPVLAGAELQGDTRTARFANGMVAHERIVDVSDERRRVAYSVLDGPGMTFHHASMEIVDAGPGRCRFVWITDFLPDEVSGNLAPLIKQGTDALKTNLEAV